MKDKNKQADELLAVMSILMSLRTIVGELEEILEANEMAREHDSDLREIMSLLLRAEDKIHKVVGPYRWEVSMNARGRET